MSAQVQIAKLCTRGVDAADATDEADLVMTPAVCTRAVRAHSGYEPRIKCFREAVHLTKSCCLAGNDDVTHHGHFTPSTKGIAIHSSNQGLLQLLKLLPPLQ